ncbi:hypothetical protein [Roseovarius sp. D22-M7]|uniref:hypothetical protein n=1 Tax=Roseovarius sp. D22-M7 TaxID=3127116 RepID=UPI00301018BE
MIRWRRAHDAARPLRESALASGGAHLGPLGSALLMAVSGDMLRLCKDTFLAPVVAGDRRPDPCSAKPGETFDTSRLIRKPDASPI